MTEHKDFKDQDETPDDVATLYSWANLHGVTYRDFSASRAQERENASQRLQEATDKATEMERQQACDKAEAQRIEEAQRLSMVEQTEKAVRAIESIPAEALGQVAQPTAAQPLPDIFSAFSSPTAAPHSSPASGRQWVQVDAAESAVRPAWLPKNYAERSSEPVSQAPEDQLYGSQDHSTSRWYALKGVFEGATTPMDAASAPMALRAPVIAFFSLAGGVGKSCLTATLGRALSACGEQVLLVDTAAYGILPFFFGAHDRRPGVLRTFRAPGAGKDTPVQMVAIDPEALGAESPGQDALVQEIVRHAHSANRVLIDLATASAETIRRIMSISPTVLVPVIPDMNSVVSVSSIDAFFQRCGSGVLPYYILNQFDPSLPLHRDLRVMLRDRLGDRLLPFVLRRSPVVGEALAEGITVIDYAPNSTVAEDFGNLVGWVRSLAATSGAGYRGVRWSER